MFHKRPNRMDPALTGRPLPPSTAGPAAAVPAAETPDPEATPAAIDISSEESIDHATSDPLAGASQAAAPVLIAGATTAHTKVTVVATFGLKISLPGRFSPSVLRRFRPGRTRGRTGTAAGSRRWQGASVLCTSTNTA